jgi:ATP-dependent Lon protease
MIVAKPPSDSIPETTEPSETIAELSRLPVNQFSLPVIPIREGVLFPHTESVLTFGRQLSLNGIEEASKSSRNLVVLLSQKNSKISQPNPSDLYDIGTLAIIERTLKSEDSVSALVRGIGRVKVTQFLSTKPFITAQVVKLTDEVQHGDELFALSAHLQKIFRQTIQLGKPVEFLNFMKLLSGVSEGELADQVASTLSVKTEEKQAILEALDVKDRLKLVIGHLAHEIKVMEIEKDVVHKTQEQFDKHMREGVLRERLRTIQKELGEIDDEAEAAEEYDAKLKKAKLPVEVKERVKKELKRLKQMSSANPESGYIRSWLDLVFDLPWNTRSESKVDLKKASQTLDKHHYGLSEVKDRVLEYLAVMQLKQQQAKTAKDAKLPTILCFAGPPGVGKTSIGQAIADALGRKFTKISLGGVRDEADIRGHRRTYVGAMHGRILKGILQAKSINPVFILDEVDKLGSDFHGDPSAALLEVLDPAQNHAFEDHYLDMPFDLSEVIFITTANNLGTIPSALRDRLEIIEYTGYTQEEKFQIAKRHLLKKVLKANGLETMQITVPDKLLETLIERYTREAGVRELERKLSTVLRKTARQLLEKHKTSFTLTAATMKEFLGPEEHDPTLTEKKDQVGLATGLAWTSVGGDVLFIEVAPTEGKGHVQLTGRLGEVMKESAQAALTYVKANAKKLGIDPKYLETHDTHIHVPEGAVPKDGPSAGVTMATAIVSAYTGQKINRLVAMTGEVTLRGRVLRIGGLKEKAIAAHRAGSTTVLIPKDNARDLVKIPASVKKAIKFIPVETMSQVLKYAILAK